MATIDTLAGLAGGPPAAPRGGSTSAALQAGLNREDFYKIMISELSNQDPFEPMDNREFLGQLVSLQTLDVTARLSDGIERLIFQNQMASASSLIGREVRAPRLSVSPEGELVVGELKGRVERVRVQNGAVELVLQGDRALRIDEVVEIS